MSADRRPREGWLGLAVAWGLLGGGALLAADEAQTPDLEFLEYLGSWEDSDEEWMLFAQEVESEKESEKTQEESVPAPDGEKLAELDDEQ